MRKSKLQSKMSHRYLFLVLLLFSFIPALGQVNDASLWSSLNIEKKITPDLSANLNQEFRFNENISELGIFFTDVGLLYKINKSIRISGNLRFINNRRLDDSYSQRCRYYLDLSFRKKFKPLVISFRTRFQSQYKIYAEEKDVNPFYYNRDKLTLKIDLDKKYTPYLSSEIFIPLTESTDYMMLDNVRYAAGVEYKFNRMHTIDLFYMIDKELNQPNPATNFITGVGYYFCF
jgi:hypothetical protein